MPKNAGAKIRRCVILEEIWNNCHQTKNCIILYLENAIQTQQERDTRKEHENLFLLHRLTEATIKIKLFI